MLNTDIKYKLSTDYDRLHDLLMSGVKLVGFIANDIEAKHVSKYSRVVEFRYNQKFKSFDFGFTFFESDFNKFEFNELCRKENVRFFDIN